ncbi:response regulator transcription factor [Oerskovia jenensis]|uniref:DNA-binding CsgD family transcriptional regulator n=1 Tax=Oerskovia jenensis TaxID=162169 RepID=A0ABS2LHF4_9CELL|nr:helix-turn-helix transcriptional regulator [Oerskovia jenensis]MBM7479294.1 DNA-binding CsgD family transcriptional regulator [Oerskovia jenensis]
MENTRPSITVLAPYGTSLGPALHAGLGARGWAVELHTVTRAEPTHLRTRAVVVIEDDDGNARMGLPSTGSLTTCVCVGSVRSVSVLLTLHGRGATVLNQSASLLSLLRLVERAHLTPGRTEHEAVAFSRTLQRRRDESIGLGRLTAAENGVLRAMVAGFSATQISDQRYLSTHTIRSHIKSILAKLQVRSQLEAVAVVRRSGHMTWLHDAHAQFTNSGEDDA